METNRKWLLMVLAVVAVLGGFAGSASAQDRLVQQSRDPITGSVAKVYRTSHGPRIDLVGAGMLVRKEVVDGRVKTTITSGRESLVIEAGSQFMSVAAGKRVVVATAADPEPLETARRLVATSPLAAKAAALIAKLGFGDRSPLQPLLLTTRAFLLAARDDDSGAKELRNWVVKARSAARTVQIIPASMGQKTPSECWKVYGDAIVDAYTDYVVCVQNIRWYDIFTEKGCALIYEVKIIGAFTWYADCVSLLG